MAWNERDRSPSTSGSSTRSATQSPLNSWPSLQSQATKEVLQSVLSVRKIWKTSRAGETVWPLDLEAALLEEPYSVGNIPARRLSRNPDARSLPTTKSLYFGIHFLRKRANGAPPSKSEAGFNNYGSLVEAHSPSRSQSADSALNSPVLPPGDGVLPGTTSSRHTIIYIDILADGSADEPRRSASNSLPWLNAEDDVAVIHASDHPRRLESINPTVSFTASSAVVAHSRFTAYSEDLIFHTETVPLVLSVHQAPPPSKFLYSTPLAPKIWSTILQSPGNIMPYTNTLISPILCSDPTRFMISQEVVNNENSSVLFSATYKFSYQRHSTSWSHPGPSRNIMPYNMAAPFVEPRQNALI
ncbi:TEA domain-containing protein [Mycena sanguinolenta]|uniref:TEA domain-containing protein n=1 Tax=Mycena sanguinolenta TaxID=230812 RepID=A0A8H7CS08_9AGAR|nr:TEA domain-containing protein [Mycena sanguinolenta]